MGGATTKFEYAAFALMKPYYVTTPIYYVNDKPHIGTAYSTIAADVVSRYQRLRGRPTNFLTGLDEHGLKIDRRAQEEELNPQDFVNRMAPPFIEAWGQLGCAHDDFIRTTEPRHKASVQRLWQMLQDNGDIYLGDYEDWYCVGCETFKTEKELLPKNLCPVHKKPVEKVKEQSYFFKLSKYAERLLDYYDKHPDFVHPHGRFNEVKSFVKEGLRDISISRTSFRWGIPVPRDPEHVMYVWLDALTNYISALGGPAAEGDAPLFDRFWSENSTVVHIVGKDILRFHAIYWPAFLLSAGIRLPDQIWAHGWLTVNGEKMSKSLGNFLAPGPLVDAFGADVLRYYLMREVGFGQDGDFSHQNLVGRYNGELANGLGNLLNRIVASIVKKNLDGLVPAVYQPAPLNKDENDSEWLLDTHLIIDAGKAADRAAVYMEKLQFHRALDTIWELIAAANRYVDSTEPWKLAKEGNKERLDEVCYVVLESLRWLSIMLWPFMPQKCDGLRKQLGLAPLMPTVSLDAWPSAWGGLAAGTQTAPGTALFPRIDDDEQKNLFERLGLLKAAPAKRQKAKPMPVNESESKIETELIEFEDFKKIDLRVGIVKEAENVPKSKKLLKLKIDIGEAEDRQILAGISEHYEAEELIGKRVVVVANLKPRKMMGLESQGMVIAASDDEGLSALFVDKDLKPGSRAK